MALLFVSNNSVSRSGVRAVSMHGALCVVMGSALLLVVCAFAAGLMLGKASAPAVATDLVKAPDPVQQKFTIARLGEMTGRLLRLESDATSLFNKIGTMETLERKLTTMQSGILASAVTPHQIPHQLPAGGPALAPQPCDQGDLKNFQPASASTDTQIAQTERTMGCLQKMLTLIQQAAAARNVAYMAMPTQQPVKGELGSPFGNRVDPINGHFAFHSGLDFAATIGSPIYSAGGGQIKFAGFRNEMGNMVEIDHGNGLVTRYAHASKLFVKTGDIVAPHQLIAAVGTTGRSTGPHLHFEVLHQGRYVNPAYYLSLNAGAPGV